MKSQLFILLLCTSLNSAIARPLESQEILSEVYSIEDDDRPLNSVEVSPEALPPELYEELTRNAGPSSFTPIAESRAYELFNTLKRDRRARMKNPGGYCSRRRIYIQSYLRKRNIKSGKLYLSCPSKNGRLRLRDQVSGRYYTYSNFHDTNIVLISTTGGNSYRVMDLQFESSPITLGSYLAQVEVYQRMRPAKSMNAGTCYWRISSPR